MPIVTTPKDICEYVGESPNRFYKLVQDEGLPAWQSGKKRKWKAFKGDLNKWLEDQKNQCLKGCA